MVSEMRKTPPLSHCPSHYSIRTSRSFRPAAHLPWPTARSGQKAPFLRDSVQYSPRMTKQSRPTESQPVNRGHHDCCQ